MKEKDASLEQWQLLCALTEKINKMEPWKQFEDMEIFTLKIPEKEDLVYVSIMGFHHMCYGLTFYIGKEGFNDISTIAYEVSDKRFENYVTMESSFFSVYFDDQKNVSWLQQHVFAKLGMDPATYPHFTIKEKGCFPDDPDSKEVDDYIIYIAGLIEALEYFLKNEIIIDFKNEMFVYDVEMKKGINQLLVLTPREYGAIILSDEEYLDSLKAIDCNEEIWEMEYNYINQGMERDDGRIINVRFSMIADACEGTMLTCVPLDEDSDEIEVVLDSLFQLIEKQGRPAVLCIDNARLLPMIGPSCDYLDIAIKEEEELEVISAFLDGFHKYTSQQNMA